MVFTSGIVPKQLFENYPWLLQVFPSGSLMHVNVLGCLSLLSNSIHFLASNLNGIATHDNKTMALGQSVLVYFTMYKTLKNDVLF